MSALGRPGRRLLRIGQPYPLIAVLAVIVVTGCGSDSASSTRSTNASTPTPAQSPAAAAATPLPATRSAGGANPTATVAAVQTAAVPAQIVEPSAANPQSWTYAPATITVRAGGTITWTNTGTSTHTVTADDGNSFDSGAIQRGDTWAGTFAKPGTYPYHCIFHAWMKGTVVVSG